MKFHTEQSLQELTPQLKTLLETLRQRRNFNIETYVEAKANVLNDYMRKSKLRACVVAVSGGIDSAVVLALVHYASKQPDSPIIKIVPIALPIFKSEFTTNQDQATQRGLELIATLGLEPHVIDLTKAFSELKNAVDTAINITGDAWASGQLVSYTRTPAIYYTTSLLSQEGKPAIVCGTTNRDEGAYLGYVGKASDGMVDVQVISDLHKSEVRKVAVFLGVPHSILNVKPTGDMFDGRIDEEVFGAPYDFVELFLLLKSLDQDLDCPIYLSQLDATSQEQFYVLSSRLEALHRYNAHKYLVGSPAYHLDIMESGVPGGWQTGCVHVETEPKGREHFVNNFAFSGMNWLRAYKSKPNLLVKTLPLIKGKGYELHNVLTEDERSELLYQANTHGWLPVGIDGIVAHFETGDRIGSYRASTFSPELAQLIWKRISSRIETLRLMADDTPTDWDDHRVWQAIGISPLFRFIRYTNGGMLVPHYDAPYIYNSSTRTLMSLILYLEARNITGGTTRFIQDPQIDKRLNEKDYRDWQRHAREYEVLFGINPEPGNAIAFDHRILHDSLEIAGNGEKIIIRTDIVFTKGGLHD